MRNLFTYMKKVVIKKLQNLFYGPVNKNTVSEYLNFSHFRFGLNYFLLFSYNVNCICVTAYQLSPSNQASLIIFDKGRIFP